MSKCKWFEKITTFGNCGATKLMNEAEANMNMAIASRTQLFDNKSKTEAAAAALPGKTKTIAIYTGAAILLLIIIKYLIK